jgi:hypothetical protein
MSGIRSVTCPTKSYHSRVLIDLLSFWGLGFAIIGHKIIVSPRDKMAWISELTKKPVQ